MLSFENDYNCGAHPKVLEHLVNTNNTVQNAYGNDEYSESATRKIRLAMKDEKAEIVYISGGTQTNQLAIDTMLEPYEGVVCAKTGHINVHEAGAIEYSSHKVIALPAYDGKIKAGDLGEYLADFYADDSHDHMVFPGMLYLSFPTEYGTLYSKKELTELRSICTGYNMRLYIDGARLAYGLCSPENDVTLEDLAKLCDAFYIGGTKAGALCGEALVFPGGKKPEHFITRQKQHGALLAKGRLAGVQFDALFENGLYFEIGRHVIDAAGKLKEIFRNKGYDFFLESPTNQQFIILPNVKMKELSEKVKFSFWEKYGEDRTVVRFATAWQTTDADLEALKNIL